MRKKCGFIGLFRLFSRPFLLFGGGVAGLCGCAGEGVAGRKVRYGEYF